MSHAGDIETCSVEFGPELEMMPGEADVLSNHRLVIIANFTTHRQRRLGIGLEIGPVTEGYTKIPHGVGSIAKAAADAGGFWISGLGLQPPSFGGEGLDRIDVVLTAHGLEPFAVEYDRAIKRHLEGVTLRTLPLERVIVSKKASNRAKDAAQIPALEATLLARGTRNES